MTPDLIYDQMIGMGCARKLTFSWGGNPGVGSLHRLRDAVEHQLAASARTRRAQPRRHGRGVSARVRRACRSACCAATSTTTWHGAQPAHPPRRLPVHRRTLAAVPAINPDVTILHAQRADRAGNVAIHGIVGAQREAALAATTLVVTVEEIVDALPPAMNAHRAAALGRHRGRALPGRRVSVVRARATTPATTPSTSAGMRSRATARASRVDGARTCWAPPTTRGFLASLQRRPHERRHARRDG